MNGYDTSIVDALRTTLHDAQDLVRGEVALAKAELRDEVRRMSGGVMALAGAAVAGLIGLVFLLTALAWAIPVLLEWPVWSGFAVVGVLVAITAAVLGVMGRKRMSGSPHMPLTMDTMKENMRWMRAQKS